MDSTKVKIRAYDFLGPSGLSLDRVPEQLTCDFDVRPYLPDPKMLKLMSKQDQMSAYVATRCLAQLNLDSKERLGLYWTTGHLPFEDFYLRTMVEKSQSAGKMDYLRFSTEAYRSFNPLITFKCLPSMPAFYISLINGLHGSYYLSYPGEGQWFCSLQLAISHLERGKIDWALVGAAVDHQNALSQWHLRKFHPHRAKSGIDGAFALLLGRGDSGKGQECTLELAYEPYDIFRELHQGHEPFPYEADVISPGVWFALRDSMVQDRYCFHTYDGFQGGWQLGSRPC